MRAVVYDAARSFRLLDRPDRALAPGEARLQVLASGVCGTDQHIHDGEFGVRFPVTPGHEMVGEVVELSGPSGLAVGDRVVVDNGLPCGRCARCVSGRPWLCPDFEALGLTHDGSVAEHVVAPADHCVPVGDLDVETAVLAEPTACVVHGLDVLGLRTAASVLVVGAGPTGQILTQLLATGGAASVTMAAPTRFKLDVAARNGATHTVQTARHDFTASRPQLLAVNDGGFDVVIDATGATSVLQQCLGLVADGGTLMVYGMTAESAEVTFNPYEIFRRELTVKGSFAQSGEVRRSVALLRAGRVRNDGLITHRFGLDQYGEALQALSDPDCLKAIIVPDLTQTGHTHP